MYINVPFALKASKEIFANPASTHDIIGWSFNKLTFHEVLSLVLKRSLQLMEQDLKMHSVAESWMDKRKRELNTS